MSLNKMQLQQDLVDLFINEQSEEVNATTSVNRLAAAMATAIENYVKSGTVNVNVATTGTATAQTGTGIGNII